MNRRAVVAGSFYSGSKGALLKELEEYIQSADTKRKVTGLISPHAGYVYSAACAGKGFGAVEVPETVVIFGVNHRGIGHPIAVDDNDTWETPLGRIAVDRDLGSELVKGSQLFAEDSVASSMEHSLEVQVPFIQYLNPEAKILPITLASHSVEALMEGGREVGRLLKGRDDVLLVASTDMSHYVDADTARVKDQKAIDKILAMDPQGLLETVIKNRISMCGVAPTTMMMTAAMEMGASTSEMINYTNSGEVSGDMRQVVGYLSMLIY